eukprot:comp18770_c2_seq1/m.20653 comp18770_c2_seq1/g.20653  ORF comp18770_c2_seq1/g.20653 comp18770_c2_seq1/m.20653 type:complete len:315 (-) comp18770_c2_seq1:151-1095(-)
MSDVASHLASTSACLPNKYGTATESFPGENQGGSSVGQLLMQRLAEWEKELEHEIDLFSKEELLLKRSVSTDTVDSVNSGLNFGACTPPEQSVPSNQDTHTKSGNEFEGSSIPNTKDSAVSTNEPERMKLAAKSPENGVCIALEQQETQREPCVAEPPDRFVVLQGSAAPTPQPPSHVSNARNGPTKQTGRMKSSSTDFRDDMLTEEERDKIARILSKVDENYGKTRASFGRASAPGPKTTSLQSNGPAKVLRRQKSKPVTVGEFGYVHLNLEDCDPSELMHETLRERKLRRSIMIEMREKSLAVQTLVEKRKK